MALADYGTAVEKIAAFKCATLDPALAYIATADFTTDDVIFAITDDGIKIDGRGVFTEETEGFTSRINNGAAISDLTGQSAALIYIKDSDISYSNPIELYQDRLARILETDKAYISNGESFTAGTYGALIVHGWAILLPTGEHIDGFDSEMCKIIPIPSSQQIKTDTGVYSTAAYFDVPSNW